MGPRGLCQPLDEKQGLPTNNSSLAPCERPWRRLLGLPSPNIGVFGIAPWTDPRALGDPWDHNRPKKHAGEGFGVHLYCLTAGLGLLAKRSKIEGRRHYSPRRLGGFTLPHRCDGTLGRGPRPRAPMQMVSEFRATPTVEVF